MLLTFRHEKRKKDIIQVELPENFSELLALEKDLNSKGYWQDLPSPPVVGGVGGVGRNTDDTWKDVLREIKSTSGRKNTINI